MEFADRNRTRASTIEELETLFAQQDATVQKLLKELTDVKYALDQSSIVAITDHRGIIIYANEQFCKISKYELEELLGQDHKLLNSGFHPSHFFKEMWATIGSGQIWRGKIRNRAKDGTNYWVDTTIVPFLDENRKPYQYVSIRNEITERIEAEENLRKSEEMYRLITENSSDLIVVIDAEGYCQYLSPSHLTTLGHDWEELTDSNLLQWVHKDDQSIISESIQNAYASSKAQKVEFRLRTKEGNYLYMEATISQVQQESRDIRQLLIVSRDITERKKSEEITYHLAYHDTLTDLPNRRLFLEHLRKEIIHAEKFHSQFAVMFLDMDRFKNINDSLGHNIGDYVLKEVARRLKSCIRPGDLIGRLGGDEFTILLANIVNQQDAEQVARDILEQLQKPLELIGSSLHLSISIGIALFPSHGKSEEDLLRRADMALYLVKEQGRRGFSVYNPAMEAKSLERIFLENELKKAIAQEQFRLVYQPKLNIATGELVGMEALVRWNHPELGEIPPNKFIHIAEETGLIIPLGEWILRCACLQNKKWQENGYHRLRIAVNLSTRQLLDDHLLATINGILEETGLETQLLELEITESVIINTSEAADILHSIRSLGVHVSIDDFGTGYSSFSYLKNLPVDTIKIDASFIRDINRNKESQAIVKAILSIAQTLNLNVIAEGIETADQLSYLKQDGCNQGQGYLFSKPLSSQDFEKYVKVAI